MEKVAGLWHLLKRIGKGGYGEVYAATDPHGNLTAIKMEPSDTSSSSLPRESAIYHYLLQFPLENSHIPRVHFSGAYGSYNVLVMDLLGPCLHDLMGACGGTLSIKTVLLVGLQVVEAVEFLHRRNIVHRDIKPSNMVMGYANPCAVYLVDLGLASFYVDFSSGVHVPFRCAPGTVTGTPGFGSVNNDDGAELSRRDDLEALLYSLVFLFKGCLPWYAPGGGGRDYERMLYVKRHVSAWQLCDGMPREFKEFFRYVRRLAFQSVPDYGYLRILLRNALAGEGFVEDYVFDWMKTRCWGRQGFPGRGLQDL